MLITGLGSAHAEGLYVGGLGTPDYQRSIDGVSGNGSGVGGKIYGGCELTPNVAVEGGLFDLGYIDDATGKLNLRGAHVDAVGRCELTPKWSVLGRVGLVEGRLTCTAFDARPKVGEFTLGIKLGF